MRYGFQIICFLITEEPNHIISNWSREQDYIRHHHHRHVIILTTRHTHLKNKFFYKRPGKEIPMEIFCLGLSSLEMVRIYKASA